MTTISISSKEISATIEVPINIAVMLTSELIKKLRCHIKWDVDQVPHRNKHDSLSITRVP